MIVEFETKYPKYRQAAVTQAVKVAFETLMPRVRKPVYINIRPVTNLLSKKGAYGDCMYEEDREFTIRFDKALSLDDMVITVLHEMVHVCQYLRRQKMDYSLPYDQQPHEIEAHEKEKQLKEIYDGYNRN